MRFIYPLLFLLLYSAVCDGQNWQTVNTNRTAHFQKDNNWEANGYLKYNIAIDSVAYQGADTLLFNRSFVEELNPGSQLGSSYYRRDTTWMGVHVMQRPGGIEEYHTALGEDARLEVLANPGQAWISMNFPNGNVLQAEVDSVTQGIILQQTDSLKYISFQMLDSLGQSVIHPINGQQITLSRNHGAVELFQMAHFPDSLQQFTLVGIEEGNLGENNLNFEEVFDFEVGDVFHTQWEEYWPPFTYYIDYEELIVVSKSYSGGIYDYEMARHLMRVDYAQGGAVTHTIDTVQKVYDPLNSWTHHANWVPFMHYEDGDIGYAIMDTMNTDFCGRTTKSTFPLYWPFSWQSPFYYAPYTGSGHPRFIFGDGLGMIRYTSWGNGISDGIEFDLVYYKKGTETCGTPISWVSVEEATPFSSARLSTLEFGFQLDFGEPFEDVLIRLLDISGRILHEEKFSGSQYSLPMEGMSKGPYLIRLNAKEAFKTYKVIWR